MYKSEGGKKIEPPKAKRTRFWLSSCSAITILNAAYKVLSQIIFRRLSPKTNEFVRSYQAGFIDTRSTTDQIFTVRQILQKCREYQVPTHHLFIDFKEAYDSIDRAELWRIMDENGFPAHLIWNTVFGKFLTKKEQLNTAILHCLPFTPGFDSWCTEPQ